MQDFFVILLGEEEVLRVYDLERPQEKPFDLKFIPCHPVAPFGFSFTRLHSAPNGVAVLIDYRRPSPKLVLCKYQDLKSPPLLQVEENIRQKILAQPFDQDPANYRVTLCPKHVFIIPFWGMDLTLMGRRFYDHVNDKLTPVKASTLDVPDIFDVHKQLGSSADDDQICKIYLIWVKK